MERAAPRSEMPAERIKAPAKVPVVSLIHPATAGPRDWPIPKMRVMNPRAAGASFPPIEFPTAAAMIAGMADRLMPKTMEERQNPGVLLQKANRRKDNAMVRCASRKPYLLPKPCVSKSTSVPVKAMIHLEVIIKSRGYTKPHIKTKVSPNFSSFLAHE
jgi:hypothetical protein